ncbi:MAG: GAF domain-containing protein, partial [Tepidiformaceae bacterium]
MTEPQPAPDQQPARIAELEARVEQLQTEIAQRDNSLARVISAESPRDKIIYGIVHEAFIAGFHYRWGIRLLEGGQLVPLRPIEIRTGPQFDFARESRDPWPVDRSSVAGSVVLDDRLHRLADCSGPDMAPYQRDVDGISTLNDRLGIRIGSRVTVPIRFAAEVVGTWSLFRTEVRPYTDDEVAGIERMAEQMGLAIGNARAAEQLERRNAELAASLTREAAVAEVSQRINEHPTDLDGTLTLIAEKARVLVDATFARMCLVDGEDLVGGPGSDPEGEHAQLAGMTARRPIATPSWGAGRAVLTLSVVAFDDVANRPGARPKMREHALATAQRSVVWVPVMSGSGALGVLGVNRSEVRPFEAHHIAVLESFAAQAAIAIETARAQQALAERNSELATALEQQTATAEVLEVISRAPSDLQSALDEVVLKASRLLDSRNAVVLRTSEAGGERVAVARDGAVARDSRLDAPTPAPNDRWEEQITTIEMRHGGPEAIQSRYPRLAELWRSTGTGSSIAAPLTTASGLFGRLVVSRQSPEPYTAGQVQLFGTFAAQAVIAIENARLFNELQDRNREVTEALDQQTAMAEVLKIISTSATQLQPVLDAVVENAARLCGVPYAGINLVDGDVLRPSSAARHHTMRLGLGPVSGFPLDRSIPPARVVIDRAPVHIYGSPEEIEAAWPEAAARTRERGIEMTQAFYGTPLMSKGEPVGVLHVMRETGEPFSSQQMSLLQTFADQAVIAIENARLFNELQERNREVTEALDQQTAMAEVLEIISKSATDAQPVLDALAERAARLCAAEGSQIHLVDGDESTIVARYVTAASAELILDQGYTAPIAGRVVGVTVERQARVHVWGRLEDFHEFPGSAALYPGVEAMCWLSVPLFREGAVIGCLQVSKPAPLPFADNHIALLEAFADQAVIAMENARLF